MMLSAENRIVLETSKITGDINVDAIKLELEKGVSWDNIIKIAAKNKVLNLLYYHMKNYKLLNYLPPHYISLLEDSNSCNYIRNEAKLSELRMIQHEALQAGILIAPVKGGYLIDNVYKNKMIRTTNDIDVLFKRKDIKIIDEVMQSKGYECGDYDFINNSVIKPDKNKKILYKTKMYNLLPYIKITNDIPNKNVMFDFAFALDFTLDTRPVEEMLDMAVKTIAGIELLPEHFLIHICSHHYREASNVAWFLLGKDLNLIKFCDVREYILQKMDSQSINKAIQFAKKYDLEKAVYFTIYFIREIYNDGYETSILESLDIKDESFLYQFGEKDYDEIQTRKKDFWTSLFSDSNKDEIAKEPKYKNLI